MSIEEYKTMPHYICDYVSKYAKERPSEIAIIDADSGKWVTWEEFENAINIIALKLLEMGYKKGDIIVSMLPLLLEHIYFEFACFKLGIIWCPLDVRLKTEESVRCVKLLEPDVKMYCHPDDTASAIISAVKKFDTVKGNTLVISGGPQQRMLYKDMIGRILKVLGLPIPPANKFTRKPYYLDWYDTRKSQELLCFQRKTFSDYLEDFSKELTRVYSPLFLPFMRYFVGPIFGKLVVRLM